MRSTPFNAGVVCAGYAIRWERDYGLSLDHMLLNPSPAPRLNDDSVDRVVAATGRRDHARQGYD